MQKSVRFTLSAVALAAAAACAPGSEIVAPASVFSGSAAELVGDRSEDYTITPGVVNVCAFFGNTGETATFTASAPAGEDVFAGVFSITPHPSCFEIWNATGASTVTVGAALAAPVTGWEVERIWRMAGDGVNPGIGQWIYGQTASSVNVSNTIGGQIWFKMRRVDVPPPPQGGDGCTPGYWRQDQHFDSWTSPYAPTTLFDDVFADAFPGKTLLDVVWMGGGGVNALGRHAVAALLNGASADVSYDLSVAQVISGFNAAYASGSKNVMNDQKGIFEMLNEQGCPVN